MSNNSGEIFVGEKQDWWTELTSSWTIRYTALSSKGVQLEILFSPSVCYLLQVKTFDIFQPEWKSYLDNFIFSRKPTVLSIQSKQQGQKEIYVS